MKVTVITACRNAATTIGDAIESVRRQKLPGGVTLEHLIIDGGSTDGTERQATVSEPDRGLYDAINKGIRRATGDVIGICNADDALADDGVVARIARQFEEPVDLVYGDVRFVDGRGGDRAASDAGSSLDRLRAAGTVRYCTGRFFRRWMFRFATFPAHPSTFVRREVFARCGLYSLDYRICADFELMLRLFWKHRVRAKYLPLCTHVMRTGGLSTGGFRSNLEINREDLRALKANGYWSCLPLIYLKYPFKIFGYVLRGGLTK